MLTAKLDMNKTTLVEQSTHICKVNTLTEDTCERRPPQDPVLTPTRAFYGTG